MKIWLVTGASRGIGLGFAGKLLERGDTVICCARDPDSAGIEALARRFGRRCIPVALDLLDPKAFDDLHRLMEERQIVIDVIIHNAGTFAEGERGVRTLKAAAMLDVLMVNAVAPLILTGALLPRLRQPGAIVAAITSGVASRPAERPAAGSQYSYSMSKAALDRSFGQLDGDLAPLGITTATIIPGFVRTDMTAGSPVRPPLSVETSVTGMLRILDNLTLNQSGRIWNWDEPPPVPSS